MYKMNGEVKELTQIRKIAADKNSENKTHTLSVYKKFTDGFYVIWASMIDLQKRLDLQNLCYSATKRLKFIEIQNVLLKVKLKHIKTK